MQTLDAYAASKLAELEARDLLRRLKRDTRSDGLHVERNSQRLLSFSCNDYLNLTHHPEVKAAAIEAVERYGAGAGASRLITGNHPLIEELEETLAAWKGADAACVFGSGYLANAGITPTLAQAEDAVFIDALAHACLWAGAKLSGARVHVFRHNDLAHLRDLMATHRAAARRALVLTDGVFSMDGDLAPLDGLSTLSAEYDAWLLCDDAHGLGVVGRGRGATHVFPSADVPLKMGTLSKAAASYGGYLCASAPVIDLIKTRARTVVYSTGLPPASAAAAHAALKLMREDAALVAAPVQNAARFCAALGLPAPESPIVPVILGDARRALDAARALEAQGFLVAPIRPPTVPANTARLRFAFTAAHTHADIERLAAAVRALVSG